MKKTLSILLTVIFFIASNAFSQNNPDSKGDVPDNINFTLNGLRVAPIVGQLNGSSATFLRPNGISLANPEYDPSCNGSFATAPIQAAYYAAYTFTATATEELVLTVETPFSNMCCHEYDPMVLLYCAPFDPANPLTNLRAGDDDSGVGFWAAFPGGSGIMIEAGNSYTVVVTHWATIGNLGGPVDYTLTIQNDVVMEGSEVPISGWALGIGLFLIIIATVFRLRKIS